MANISGFQPEDEGSIPFTCSIPFNGIVHIILRAVQQIFIRKSFLLKKDDAILMLYLRLMKNYLSVNAMMGLSKITIVNLRTITFSESFLLVLLGGHSR